MYESMQLIQWDEYLRQVAVAYAKAPVFDSNAVPSYQAVIRDVDRFFRMIQSKVEVQWVDYDPYRNAEELTADVVRNKRLRVMTLHSEHPVFTPEQNWKFRAAHDWFSHILGHTSFSPKGEIAAYNTHAKMFSRAALPALFTEIVGQVAYLTVYGSFPTQKVAVLPGFNYARLGEVEGFTIQNKVLYRDTTHPRWQQQEAKQAMLHRLSNQVFELGLQEMGPEAKRPHKCAPADRFNVLARRCVPLASMLNRKHHKSH